MHKIKISSSQKERLIKVAQHEASHYIIAKILGFKTGVINIEVTDMYEGHTAGAEIYLSKELKSLEQTIEYIENRIIVLYSGVLGESFTSGKVDNNYALDELYKGGKSDFDKCRELLQILNNIKFPDVRNELKANQNLDEINNKLWNRAIELVEREHLLIKDLGNRMASELQYVSDKFELSQKEVEELPSIKQRFQEINLTKYWS